MWNCKPRDEEIGRQGEGANTLAPRLRFSISPLLLLLLLTAHCSLLTGCRRDMQDQPKMIAYRENAFYKHGASRPPVDGPVPRGYFRADRAVHLGQNS